MHGMHGVRAMTGRAARVVAQAKVNLFLGVLAREESGFHQIETLFCRVDFGDDVVVRVTDAGTTIDCRGADVGPAEQNLAFRAAELYRQAAEWPRGYAIEIEKRIPVGGGLGGGSADAAAVLRALNRLNPQPLAAEHVAAIAARLGADVPFLAAEAPLALAWGRGERLLFLPALPPRPVILLAPPFSVPTKDAYRWLAAHRARPRTPDSPAPALRPYTPEALSSWVGVQERAGNEFEGVVFERHPRLARYVAALAALPGARIARMSGSGSTLFGVYDEAPDLAALPPLEGARAIMTATASHVAPVVVTG
jgi:4-diphosphocytidyl-2-C-methyl-D-erythritol kinase